MSQVQLANWIRVFANYYSASNMQLLSVLPQQAYFSACLDEYLKRMVFFKCTEAILKVTGEDSCVLFLKEELLLSNPIYTRRLDFFRAKHKPG
jgi:hypothetical protein